MQVQRAVPLLSSVSNVISIYVFPANSGPRTVSVDVRVGAVLLEVRVVGDTGGRAGRGSVVLATAAVGGVLLVAVEVGLASTAAADGEARGVVGALECRRAVRAKVDGAAGDAAALVVVDADGQVVAVNERDYTS